MNYRPLLTSVLLSLPAFAASAAELTNDDLCSLEATYLKAESLSSSTEMIDTSISSVSGPNFEYIDSYDKSLFSIGELEVERRITLDAAGTQVRSDTFNVGLHIAVNYTP